MNSQGKTTPEPSQDATKQIEKALGPDAVQRLRDHDVLEPFVRLVRRHCDPWELWAGLAAVLVAWWVERPQREGISVQADTSVRAVRDLAVKNRVQAKAEPRQAAERTYEPEPRYSVELFPRGTFDGEIGFDRSELRTVIKRMRQCADDLKRLNVHGICHILSEKYRFPPETPGCVLSELPQLLGYHANLAWPLRLLALATETAAKHIYLRGHPRPMYDSAVASLVRYVRRTTRPWCDEEVSALIAATRGDDYDAVAHRDWRKRNRKLLR